LRCERRHAIAWSRVQTCQACYCASPCGCNNAVRGKDGVAGDFTYLTYQEVADKVKAFATSLAATGLKKGDRVAVFGANCTEWMIAMQVRACCPWVGRQVAVLCIAVRLTNELQRHREHRDHPCTGAGESAAHVSASTCKFSVTQAHITRIAIQQRCTCRLSRTHVFLSGLGCMHWSRDSTFVHQRRVLHACRRATA
jgi:hypothetical protein